MITAKETIERIKKCTTLNELEAYDSDKRKSVKDALNKKRNELLSDQSNNSKPTEESSSETGRDYSDFLRKIPPFCRWTQIVKFAAEYFGKEYVGYYHENGSRMVQIKLKDGNFNVGCI
jgi:hypothetical protein